MEMRQFTVIAMTSVENVYLGKRFLLVSNRWLGRYSERNLTGKYTSENLTPFGIMGT